MKLKNIIAHIRRWAHSPGRTTEDVKNVNPGIREQRRSETYRLRVESCIEAILRVNETMDLSVLDAEVVQRFEHLKSVMQEVDPSTIREQDLLRIEDATNRLLQDIRVLCLTKRNEVLPTEERMN